MNRDANLVARKLETFFDHPDQIKENEAPVKKESAFKNLLCILLMSFALILTKTSLILTRLVKKLEA